MYPRALNSAPFNLYGLPPDQVHQFHAESFYWAPDSKSVIVADEVQAQLSVVWVRIGPRDQLTAYIHPVSSVSEVCKSAKASTTTGILTLANATVGGSSEAPEILVEFRSYDGDCVPKTLVLYGNDFKAAGVERHAWASQKASDKEGAVRADWSPWEWEPHGLFYPMHVTGEDKPEPISRLRRRATRS